MIKNFKIFYNTQRFEGQFSTFVSALIMTNIIIVNKTRFILASNLQYLTTDKIFKSTHVYMCIQFNLNSLCNGK